MEDAAIGSLVDTTGDETENGNSEGRSINSDNTSENSGRSTNGSTTGSKRRGRPPGSRNKTSRSGYAAYRTGSEETDEYGNVLPSSNNEVTIDAGENGEFGEGGKSLPTKRGRKPNSKSRDVYVGTLQGLWYRSHKLTASFIDDDLAWTQSESKEFAELAYEVCLSHDWLKWLDHANEAQLIFLIIALETEKVRKVLAKTNDNRQSARPKPQLVTRENAGTVERQGSPTGNGGFARYTEPARFAPNQQQGIGGVES